jgi:hypothetical protein
VKIREILNIILINLIVFFALVSIHEMGHTAAGMLLGCAYQRSVLMDANLIGPYTEMYCSGSSFAVFISGLLVTSAFSALFLFLRSPSKNLFLISMGLSLIFSSLDVGTLLNMQSAVLPLVSFGFVTTALGEYFIAASYARNSFSLDLLDIEPESADF